MKKIFVVDDNEEFKDLVHDYFTTMGYEVVLASSGTNSAKEALENLPDIIFLDVMMPDKSGIEVIRELQKYNELKEIPVIVITGSYFDENTRDLFFAESNCRGFMTKSSGLDQIEKKIIEIIGK